MRGHHNGEDGDHEYRGRGAWHRRGQWGRRGVAEVDPAADTTMDVQTGEAEPPVSANERAPQTATDAPAREGDTGTGNDLPHGMGAGLSDDELGGTMAQGAASPGTVPPDRHDRDANPDVTDTDTDTADTGWQHIRNPPA